MSKIRALQLILLVGVSLMNSGCPPKPKPAPSPAPAPQPAPAPVLQEEAGVFFWFNSRVISDAGHNLYGQDAYRRFLPSLAQKAQKDPKAWFALFDGDCGTDTTYLKEFFRPQDAKLLDEAHQVGESLCYVIAVLGQTARDWDEIDRDLRNSAGTGYMGMTMQRTQNRDTFLNCRRIMSLVVAIRIDGARFKKISFEFLSDGELAGLGFEPYTEKRD